MATMKIGLIITIAESLEVPDDAETSEVMEMVYKSLRYRINKEIDADNIGIHVSNITTVESETIQ